MWEFFDRLVSIAIPRIRDFRGCSTKSFDGRGNYSLGVTEQQIFPEIPYDKIDRVRGMDITFVTTAQTNEEGEALLRRARLPLQEVEVCGGRRPRPFASIAPPMYITRDVVRRKSG